MNYARTYDDFTSNRQQKEIAMVASGLYAERHHIKPLSFAGWHHTPNLVRLTYRDHLFALALLVKTQPAGTD